MFLCCTIASTLLCFPVWVLFTVSHLFIISIYQWHLYLTSLNMLFISADGKSAKRNESSRACKSCMSAFGTRLEMALAAQRPDGGWEMCGWAVHGYLYDHSGIDKDEMKATCGGYAYFCSAAVEESIATRALAQSGRVFGKSLRS